MKAIRLVFALVSILLISSCSDYFEIDRPPQAPWSTVEEFERAPIGAYTALFSGDEWNLAWVHERFIKTNMGDDVGFADELDKGFYRETKQANQWTELAFIQLYKAIATTNNALEFVDSKAGNPYPDALPTDIQNNVYRIVGELYFVRAYAYFLLQTTFGHAYVPGGDNTTLDIPMPIRYAKSADEARNPKIGSTQEVYDLIVRDLKKAKALLPEKFDASKHHPSYQVRANRVAAAGMLMRAYMQKGSYDSALQECNYIIDQNSSEYDLSEDPIVAFSQNSAEGRGKEVIFYVPFFDANLTVPNHLSVINQTWAAKPTEWVQNFMDFTLVKKINWMTDPKTDTALNIEAKQDKRFTQLMTVRYPVNKRLPGQAYDLKERVTMKDFTTIINNKYYRSATVMNTNVPLIRLAEVYLTRSVLRFRASDKVGAASDLDEVRKRAWNASVAGAAYTPISSAAITEEMINDERIIEMFNEGDRINYLRALKVPIPKGERGAGTDPYMSESFVWAIPALEINFNDGI